MVILWSLLVVYILKLRNLQSLYMWNILYPTPNKYWLLSYTRIYSWNSQPPTPYSRCIRNQVIGASSRSRYAPLPPKDTSRLMSLRWSNLIVLTLRTFLYYLLTFTGFFRMHSERNWSNYVLSWFNLSSQPY